jgi:tetratricopeptide (TPR) repeat protein
MKAKASIILLIILINLGAYGQSYIYKLHGIDDFINKYISEYSQEDVVYYDSVISILPTDSLEYMLSDISSKISIWNITAEATGQMFITKETYDFNALLAMLSFNELMNRDIRSKKVYYCGADLKFGLRYYKNAIKDYTLALNSKSSFHIKDYLIIGDRGESKFETEDYYGAIADLTIAIDSIVQIGNKTLKIESQSHLISFLISRGKSYLYLNKFNEALSDFSNSLNLNPKYRLSYYYRGITYLSMKKIELGCNDLSKAGELGYERAYDLIKEYCNPK